ncbi:MAG: MFS transporter, partial [Actinomycetota bacterium]|nr:MFS transporter [Actinomycetota bacterium]
AIGTFTTPVLQRYYGLSLVSAASVSGVIIGVMGLLGLVIGGRLCDRAAQRSASARVRFAALCLLVAAPLAYLGLAAGQAALWQLVAFLSLAYLSSIVYLAASTPAVADVVRPEQRSAAMGVLFAVGYLLGGAGGPIAVGLLSDALAKSSTGLSADAASAHGLQAAMMILVPIAFLVAAAGMWFAARSVTQDREAMLAGEGQR